MPLTANFTAAIDDVGNVTGVLSSGHTTDDTALMMFGTNVFGSAVNVYNGTALLGAATVTGTNWSYSATITNGVTYQFNVKETDAAGNTSAPTGNFTVIGDTTAPNANFAAVTDDVGSVTGALSTGNSTDDTALVLSGSNETGSTVKVYDGAILLGAATVTGTNWSYTAIVADGPTYQFDGTDWSYIPTVGNGATIQFNVKETDAAGNTSAATGNFTVISDTKAPAAPVIGTVAADNIVNAAEQSAASAHERNFDRRCSRLIGRSCPFPSIDA